MLQYKQNSAAKEKAAADTKRADDEANRAQKTQDRLDSIQNQKTNWVKKLQNQVNEFR